ncbi:MAG: cobyric acid synthase [Kineosporiaceae bacterium]|nr:cobyric acid synthase [Kineosporiaceae bacterium]
MAGRVGAMGSLLVAGTTSDAGKSVLTAGICRWLHRHGVSVAPFKAQNMSNNSVVTADGGEIGRAQGLQAAACGLEPEVAMNPILLKPGGETHSHLLVRGRPDGEVTAMSYPQRRDHLRGVVLASFDELAARHDVVVCEGAGGAAEINLRRYDLVNLGLARERDIPVVVVGDIERGGVFAALFGTVALLEPADQALVAGFVINRFRGDVRLLEPGPAMLERLTGRPVLGVLPWLRGLTLDVEDSQSLDLAPPLAGPPLGRDTLTVVAIHLPRTSNATDVDALATEPGVQVRWTTSPGALAEADLVVLPGSRATVADLGWLHERGLADALTARAASGGAILGICGGYQMLARTITDRVESAAGEVAGLGLLPAVVEFTTAKTVRRVSGEALGEMVDTGYEIHHGQVRVDDGARAFLDGCRHGNTWGTTWHAALESNAFRRAFLQQVAGTAGRDFVPAPDTDLAAVRARRLDVLADLVADHLDVDRLRRLIEDGAPPGLPVVPPAGP